ncbi:DUF3617 family protein [Phenylobacterium aquaticum]|uniref:DUF3617 domain-containing protein n=1 Tax=Phenylobacterium aquaticum TaxID=1763816 RepID=UPI0026F07703|nr:DUF3617 family protein [Phenylobacterium aquaticum]
MNPRVLILATAVALTLSACSKTGDQAAKPPANGAAAPPSQTAPKRKPGLWEQRVSNGDFVQVSRICLDEATDAKLSWWGAQATQDVCEKNLASSTADGGWRFSSVCDMGSGGKTTTSGLAAGDFNSHYQITAESSTVGAQTPMMNGTRKMVIDAAWQGPCPAGMAPGQMSLPGGVTINLLDAAK